MTYREVFDKKLSEIEEEYDDILNMIDNFCNSIDIESIESIEKLNKYFVIIDKHKNTLSNLVIKFDVERLRAIVDLEFRKLISEEENIQRKKLLYMREKVLSLREEKLNKIREHNSIIIEEVKVLAEKQAIENNKLIELELERQKLLEYSNEILQICSNNGIKISDINISNNMFTYDELKLYYADFYSFIETKTRKGTNPISWLRDKTNENNGTLAFIAVALFILAFSPIKILLSISFLLYILYSQSNQESTLKRYTILAGLAFNINTKESMTSEVNMDNIEGLLEEDVDIDNDEDFKPLMVELEQLNESDNINKIKDEHNAATIKFLNDLDSLKKEYDEFKEAEEENKAVVVENLLIFENKVKEHEKLLKSRIKKLGEEFNQSGVFNTNLKLGLNEETMIYEYVDIGLKNIVINPCNDINLLNNFIKVLIANFLCNVRPGFLDITVVDPNDMGRSLAGFYNEELDRVFKISKDELSKVLDDLRAHNELNMKKTKGRTIQQYNEEAVKSERLTLYYKLLIVLSQPKSVEEDEALSKFIEYSAEQGIFVWIISSKKFSEAYTFKVPFENIKNPINIDPYNFPTMIMDNLEKASKNLKSPALLWEVFKNKAIPDDKIWTYSADEFIDLDPGFEGGDPSKNIGYTVGNTGDIHALCVGGTGAGKSVFINNIICNICSKYSPKDVALWLVDFKGSEFNFYLKKPHIGQNYILPHIEACLCTSDPDYSVSLFGALREMAEKRYKALQDRGFKNMMEMNKTYRKQGKESECFKRTIVIADEFQVIFEKTDAKAQDKLKKDITYIAKVARACGIHLFFCSQSMTGTVSNDILSQFTLRFGLRCPMEVSKAIMGTTYSGDIREPNGYLYISSIRDKKAELQKMYRTPYIPDSDLRNRINLLAQMCESEKINQPTAITYDETTIHPIEEVDVLFTNDLKDKDVTNLFILGERMVYSNRGRRSNIILSRDNNQHIFSSFSNTKDMVMFFNTLMASITYNGAKNIILNTQVKDLGYLFCMDKYLNETNLLLAEESQTPTTLLPIFKNIIDSRQKIDNIATLSPLYIILIGWDKAIKFGISSDYKMTDAYNVLLQTCSVLNIHFIFITSALGDIPKSIVAGCRNRIAGKVDEKTSMALLDSSAAYKTYEQKDGYMFFYNGGEVERLKIYQSKIERRIKETSINI